jgi:hypothetical protein
MPHLTNIQGEDEHTRVSNYLRKVVEEDKLFHYEYYSIGGKIPKVYMIIVKKAYKITKLNKNL